MSFDKTKAMRNAERFLAQGKIRAAIGEYKGIVENDPKDFSTLNILGDLYVKTSEEGEAVGCYTQVAEHYSKQGFSQKAIAIYNKISRLKPDSMEVSAKLAQLYQMRGSIHEARSHYVSLAENYQRIGKKAEALEIWKRIADLDPTNADIYLKIAETYGQENQPDEAAQSFTEAAFRLVKQEKYETALDAFSKALEIKKDNLPALNGFIKVQIKLGHTDEAIEKLENLLEGQSSNSEIIYLLIDCYLDINNPEKAEKAVIKLVEHEPANYPKFLDIVRCYLKNNDCDAAGRILSMSSEHLLVGGQHDEFLKWTNEILAQNPEHLEGLRLLVRYHSWQRDETELKNALERLAEGARLNDSIDDERSALSQLVMIVPHQISYAQRLQEINTGVDFDSLPMPVTSVKQEISPDEIPNYTDVVLEDAEDVEGDIPPFDSYVEFDGEVSLAGEDPFPIQSEKSGQNGSSNGEKGFLFELGSEEAEPDKHDNAEVDSPGTDLKLSDELRLDQELESIEFYIAQGYKELAEKSLSVLEAEFGNRPGFERLREQLDDSLQTLNEKTLPKVELIDDESPIVENVEAEDIEQKEFSANYTDEVLTQTDFNIMDEFRNELGFEEEEAPAENDFDTHYHMATAYKEMGLVEDAIREFQDAVNLVAPDDSNRRFFKCCIMLGHCFMEKEMPNLALMWYKRALDTPNLSNEEHQAMYYEIANAYEAGEDFGKAVECFEKIYAENVDYRDISSRLETLRANNPHL